MSFLRTVSTRRLLALLGAIVAVAAGGTAIAVAATSGGPVPRQESLARAVHDVLSAPAVTGITADISFTNQLISSSNLGEVASPLLTGGTGRLWLSTDHQHLRVEIQGNNGDAQAVVNGQSFWIYDPSANTVYEGTLPAGSHAASAHAHGAPLHNGWSAHGAQADHHAIPTLARIQDEINRLAKRVGLSGAIPGDVAGEPTYTVRVSPLHSGGLLGAAAIAFDAVHGVPLSIGVYATGSSSPVLQLTATNISFGAVPASSFAVSPPPGAKVVNVSVPSAAHAHAQGHHAAADVTGAANVARHVSFSLLAPGKLVGLPRHSVRLVNWSGSPAALIAYGQNLGGIIVIERAAPAGGSAPTAGNGHHSQLSLPTVSIDGTTGTELDTALGTMIHFTRAGVDYTVLGSVPPVAAEAAARGL